MSTETTTSYQVQETPTEFPEDDGWNISLGISVKLHVYERFFNLWRTGGYNTASDYISHMLLLEEHCQAQFRNPNESDPHNRNLLKEEPMVLEYDRGGLLGVADSAKQQEALSTLSESPPPVSPLPSEGQVSTVSYAGLPQQRITIPDTNIGPTLNDIQEVISKQHINIPHLPTLLQAKMAGIPPLVPVSVVSASNEQYLLPHPQGRKLDHTEPLHQITEQDLQSLKNKINDSILGRPNENTYDINDLIQSNSPPRPSIPDTPKLQKLPGIGEIYKRPVLQENGFQTSPNQVTSAPEVSSTSDSLSPDSFAPQKRPSRQKAELAKQFIHSVCMPDSEDLPEDPRPTPVMLYSRNTIDDLDDSDCSDTEDANNNNQGPISWRIECETCQEIFLRPLDLESHYHENPDHKRHVVAPQMYNCEICAEPLEGRHAMRAHCREKHPMYFQSKVQKLCSLCSEVLPNRSALRHHLKTHGSDLTICPEKGCGRVLRKQHIPQHMSKVHGENQVSCDECHKVFRNQLALKAHTQNVHKGFKYVCSFAGCHRSFKRPSTLKVHELIHKDFKPMKCKLCPFRCRQQASISHHFKQHHPGVKPGFLRQSEDQFRTEIANLSSPMKQGYMQHQEMSPPEQIQSPDMMHHHHSEMSPPEHIHSPEMMSQHHSEMAQHHSERSSTEHIPSPELMPSHHPEYYMSTEVC